MEVYTQTLWHKTASVISYFHNLKLHHLYQISKNTEKLSSANLTTTSLSNNWGTSLINKLKASLNVVKITMFFLSYIFNLPTVNVTWFKNVYTGTYM